MPGAVGAAADWVGGAVDWLGNLLDPTGEILAKLWPPILAVIATVALLRLVRWLLLLWRGRTPRVQISNFAWASGDGAGEEAAWVTSLFREQLSALRLDGLDPLPERAPGAPLVELVEGVGQGVGRDIGSAVGRLFRAAWPDSAYEVWATLRPRPSGGGKISVQLIERRRGNRTLLNVALEEASWEVGAREAAMAVAGALYPRVGRSHRGPWTLWEHNVPRQLLAHYHAARRFEEKDCLEPALAAYHAALDLDPLNPNLRLKIAMLQERLELHLDAWVTYEAIVDESDRRAWRGPNRRVYLLALYRLAVLLGNGRVAPQWAKRSTVKMDEGFLRDSERQQRRDELLSSLEPHPLFAKHRIHLSPNELPKRFTRFASIYLKYFPSTALLSILRTVDDEAEQPGDALEVFRQSKEDKQHEERIEAVLQILSLQRLEELETALRPRPPRPRKLRDWWIRHPPPRQWLVKGEFAKSAVRTSKLLVRIRIAASLEAQVGRRFADKDGAQQRDRWIREIRQAHRNLTRRWPFPPVSKWRTTLHFLAPRRRWANRREDAWQLHYNAACATAALLRSDSVLHNFENEPQIGTKADKGRRALSARTDKERVLRRAIAQLEEYAFRAGSDRVAAQADWVAIDDPDLVELRESPEFKLWASHHLPRALPRSLSSRKTDVKRFTIRLVHDGARIFAATWRERASLADLSAAEIVEWWRVENEVWTKLQNASREHLSWQERLKWLTALQDWLSQAERKDEVNFSHEARGTAAADSMSKGLFEELSTLAGDVVGSNGAPDTPATNGALGWTGKRAMHVRTAHEAGEERADADGALRAQIERDEALRAARVWARLAEVLEVELDGSCEGGSDEELRERMERVREELIAVPVESAGANRSALATLLAAARNHLPWQGRSRRGTDERDDRGDRRGRV